MDDRELERIDIIADLEALLAKINDDGPTGTAMRRGIKRAINVVEDRRTT